MVKDNQLSWSLVIAKLILRVALAKVAPNDILRHVETKYLWCKSELGQCVEIIC